jgi:hypothetical protein
MRTNGGGDRLARGAVRASFLTNESNKITQATWDAAFDNLDTKAFVEKEPASRVKVAGAVKESSRSKR